MAKMLIVLLVALFFEAAGVVYLSKGLKQVEGPTSYMPLELARLVMRGVMNKFIVLGVACEALFFAGLLYLMSRADVSFVWPLTSLSFVFTTIAARLYLHEQVSSLRWAGVVLIMCGAALITYSEKVKPQPSPAATSGSGQNPGLENFP